MAASPDHPLNAALDALKADDAERAARSAEAALDMLGEHGAALNILGLARYRQGRYADAAELLARARAVLPEDSALLNQHGMALLGAERPADAATALTAAVAAAPTEAAAVAIVPAQVRALQRAGDADRAAHVAQRWLAAWPPADPTARGQLAELAQQVWGPAAAEAYFRDLVARPDPPAWAYAGLGDAHFARRAWPEALAAYRQAARLEPDWAKRHHDLALTAFYAGENDQARSSADAALACDGGHGPAWNLRGALNLLFGEPGPAVGCFGRALASQPQVRDHAQGIIFALHHLPDIGPALMQAQYRLWARRWADRGAPADPAPRRAVPAEPAAPLRVGFLSGDFRPHPAGYFALPAFAHLPRSAVEVHALDLGSGASWLTDRLHAACDAWHTMPTEAEPCCAALARLELDVLVDLTGLLAGNVLPRFGRRLAPVQAKWVGGQYATTTLPEMDLFITDPVATPPGWEGDFTEALLRLPGGYTAYAPPPYAPDPAIPPADRPVTLGCLNKPAKLCRATLDLWAAILRARPQTRLVLVGPPFDDPTARQRWLARFAKRGVAGERLRLYGQLAHGEALARYAEIDLALDPLAYSGGLTTCEALRQGVPVLTCPGRRFTARHAASRLAAADAGDWIVADSAAYYETALAAIDDPQWLAHQRRHLATSVPASALMDGPRHGRELAHGLTIAWRRRQAGQRTRRPIDAGAAAAEQVEPGAEPPAPWPSGQPCLAPAGPT